ncbi:MAG: glucose 1-dehydrogenase [Chloroflexi bacterium]|nr:glucose 1-dehydrogenase [Chloroflexota bacterium]
MGLLEGKVALVTGSAGGIGLGIARRFAREGAKLIICDIDADRLPGAAGQVEEDGGEVIAVHSDVSVESDVEKLFAQAVDRFGTLDILVNNALMPVNLGERGPFLKMRAEGWDRFMAANLGMLFYCSHRAAKIMARKRNGSIINISTNGAVRPHRNSVAYDAMKGAVDSFTRATAVDLAPWGVRVNSIQPGLIATRPFLSLSELEQARRATVVPTGRAGTPADIAWAATFLAADDASHITGISVLVDGGLITQGRAPQAELSPVPSPETVPDSEF